MYDLFIRIQRNDQCSNDTKSKNDIMILCLLSSTNISKSEPVYESSCDVIAMFCSDLYWLRIANHCLSIEINFSVVWLTRKPVDLLILSSFKVLCCFSVLNKTPFVAKAVYYATSFLPIYTYLESVEA